MLNLRTLSRPDLRSHNLSTTRGVATGFKGPDTLFDFVRKKSPGLVEVIPLITFVSAGLFGGILFGFYHLNRDPHLRLHRSGVPEGKVHIDEPDEPLKRVLEMVEEHGGE